jgi:ribosomal protein S18 acetylase RimI-like enzyme
MKTVEKFGILKSFIDMHKGSFITKIENIDKAILAYSEGDSEIWWNFALLRKPIQKEDLDSIEAFFTKLKRKPSIYFSDDKEFDQIPEILKKESYKLSATDSWLSWERESPQIDNLNVIEVKSDENFKTWVETFVKSYPKDDPKNPYGEQKEFAKNLGRLWKTRKRNEDQYFLALDNDSPVATGILTTYGDLGYISGIGSIPSARGKGFGKKISLYCVRESFNKGNRHHSIATEEGTFPFEFYKRIGFTPKFVAYLYSKENLE